MVDAKVYERLLEILSEFNDGVDAQIKQGGISRESAMADLGLDSLDMVELIIKVEDTFKISIEESEYTAFATLREAEIVILTKLRSEV